MNDQPIKENPNDPVDPTMGVVDETSDPVSPDELMQDFRGKGLVKIVLFTVVVHALFIGAFTIGSLFEAELTQEQKVDRAVREMMDAIREIADKYELEPSDLVARFDKPAAPPATTASTDEDDADTGADSASDGPSDGSEDEGPTGNNTDDPQSDYEKNLRTEEEGPVLPDLNVEDDVDELFAPETP